MANIQLENHDTFYITLCFFTLIIVLAVLSYCIIMTEIIVYDTRQLDRHTLNIIARLEKLVHAGKNLVRSNRKCHFKTNNRRKWKQFSKMHRGSTEIKLKQKKEKKRLRIETGTTVEQLINVFFEAMLIEFRDRSDMKNILCISIAGDSIDESTSEIKTVPEFEKTLQDLMRRQNTLAMLIQTLSKFEPKMLERLVSPDVSPRITYQDILNRLNKLQDQAIEKQQITWVPTTEHDRVNKKLMGKVGESESIILEDLMKKIKMAEETMEIVDPEEGTIKLPWVSAEEINRTSPTINTKLTAVEHHKVEQSNETSSNADFTNAVLFDAKQTNKQSTERECGAVESCDARLSDAKPSHAATFRIESIDAKPSVAEPIETKFSDLIKVVPEFEKTLQDLMRRQNTSAMLIQTLSTVKPEMLEQLVSSDVFPSITYQNILNRLKKLQDQAMKKQQITWVRTNEHDRANKKRMSKVGKAEGIILEGLIKKTKMTEETTKIVGSEEGIIELPWVSAVEVNRTSPTVNTKLADIEHHKVEQSDVTSSNADFMNAEPFDVKQTDAESTEKELSAVKSCDVRLPNVEETNMKPSHAAPIHI